MFALGPYFNLLPLLTVVLMIWQQKVLTPPPTDEQAIMMQKMMKYMMVFMGLMFFKVASGLCIYIVVSSLWSMIERRFLPKAAVAAPAASCPRPGTSCHRPSDVDGARQESLAAAGGRHC